MTCRSVTFSYAFCTGGHRSTVTGQDRKKERDQRERNKEGKRERERFRDTGIEKFTGWGSHVALCRRSVLALHPPSSNSFYN